ncbi:hypothetical protein JRQ81_004352 [Phrynocephalus forsythii]|uniref:C2 domain-containing protein n=1 Tax=Phrynocephalus forsythii TaxID=171643 RepID=A0A9Q0XFS7_9SAUR|nr:hypothetical protein JRQ81_004352 [Phrynocephalus forsythii]
MSLLLLDETAGDLPVRDTNQKPSVIAAIRDVSSSATLPVKSPGLKTWMKGSRSLARTRRQINRVSRTELEDGFLRLHDENLLLKEFARKQEDRIKRMGTKLLRHNHARVQVNERPDSWIRTSSRNLDLEEELEGAQERVRELERRNEGLKSRLLFYKQQLQLQSCGRHCPYGYVPARVNSGLRRAQTAAGRVPDRLRQGLSGIRVQGPPARPTHTAPPSYGDHVPDVEMEKLTHSLVLAELEPDPESLSSTHPRETDPESGRSQQLHLEAQERRVAIRDNLELIRLQKTIQAKNSELVAIKAQFAGLQENQEALRSASEALLAQVQELSALLREETQKVSALESQLETLSPVQEMLKEFQERVGDLEAERDLLKMNHDKLLESCLSAAQQKPDELSRKDNVPSMEEQLASLMAEKKNLKEQLENERARNEEPKQETKQQPLDPEPEAQPSQEKAALLEERKTRVEKPPPQLLQPWYVDGLEGEGEKEEAVSQKSLKRKLHETEAAHAETVLELEKTRDMLILQHRINRDYQVKQTFSLRMMLQATREKEEHEEKEQQMARLLDLRSARIHQLEEQLKDVAYGTRAAPFRPDEGFPSAGAEPDQAPKLRSGENLFEIHISGAVLSAEALRLVGDPEPVTFCTYSFYDFETHCTPMARGGRPCYGFTSQYVVQVEPLFLQYLQGATTRLELHLASATDHATLASCPNGEDYGLLEYWVRLRFPIEQTLRLHRQRTKALGYLSAGVPRPTVAPENWPQQQEGGRGPGWNELRIRVEGCAGVRSRWLGAQPSPYVVYRFFTFPDHDTVIVPSSNAPHFGDSQSFALRATPELHHYLLLQSLGVYVFDDEDEEPGSYLGKAQIPLVPLAQGRSITEALREQKPAIKAQPTAPKSQTPKEASASPLLSGQERKKPRLFPPKAEKRIQEHTRPEGGPRQPLAHAAPAVEPADDQAMENVGRVAQEVSLEKLREESEERPTMEEETVAARLRKSDSASSVVAEEGSLKDTASEERESTSDTHTTESDEVVLGASEIQDPLLLPSNRIRVEIISLSLHPDSEPVLDEFIQQLYVEYRFPGVPLEETETPFSLRKPQGGQEVYFHFSKVINLDSDPDSLQRRLLFSMLDAEDPEQNRLQFVVVSEPLPGAGGECEDVGLAYLDLREILLTGQDAHERELHVFSPFDPDVRIGRLKITTEAFAALSVVYYAGQKKNGRDG